MIKGSELFRYSPQKDQAAGDPINPQREEIFVPKTQQELNDSYGKMSGPKGIELDVNRLLNILQGKIIQPQDINTTIKSMHSVDIGGTAFFLDLLSNGKLFRPIVYKVHTSDMFKVSPWVLFTPNSISLNIEDREAERSGYFIGSQFKGMPIGFVNETRRQTGSDTYLTDPAVRIVSEENSIDFPRLNPVLHTSRKELVKPQWRRLSTEELVQRIGAKPFKPSERKPSK